MDRFQEMQVFLTVVEAGGFSVAARRLAISPASATRAVVALEKRIGVPLLVRNTRRMRLSEVGEYFLIDCRQILERLREADEGLVGIYANAPSGLLTICAPVLFGERHIAPLLVHYMTQFKDVNVSSIFQDRCLNMAEHGIDVAVRIGGRVSNDEHAIKIGEVRQILCASPAYLDGYGRPACPEHLLEAETISSLSSQRAQEWQFMNAGICFTQKINPRLSVTTTETALNIARRGFGITRALSYQISDAVTQGALEIILEAYEPPSLPINIVMRKNNCASVKIRSFVDFLTDHLQGHHTLNAQAL